MKNTRNNVIKKISKLFGNKPKEDSLATIFKPLNGIEEKITIRQAILKERILQLEDDMNKIDDQVTLYEEESKRCNEYLIMLSKLK